MLEKWQQKMFACKMQLQFGMTNYACCETTSHSQHPIANSQQPTDI